VIHAKNERWGMIFSSQESVCCKQVSLVRGLTAALYGVLRKMFQVGSLLPPALYLNLKRGSFSPPLSFWSSLQVKNIKKLRVSS